MFSFVIIPLSQSAKAEPSREYFEYMVNDVLKSNLDEKPKWLSLLHYRENTFTNSYYSEIDGTKFFNAEKGHRDPRAEILATIKAMHSTNINNVNNHPQCLFPARLSWLKNNLPSFNKNLPQIKCKKFLEWRHFLNAESLSLVFVSPNVESPGSLFGNTFLKINPPKLRKNVFNKDKNLLPAKAISYAIKETEQHQDEWFYSLKAAFGSYPGKLTVEPYFDRIARYPNIENRDLWEYELNLSPFETDQLLEHVWELMHAKIDYYYLDENSAYLLLSLLDAAKPELKLTKNFSLQVLPVDTISLLIEKEVITDIKYLPSTLTNIVYHLSRYPNSQQNLISDLIDGSKTTSDSEFKKLASTVQVFVIEIANQYLQLSFQKGEIDRISYNVRSLRLHKAREKLDPLIELPNAPPPSIRPDQGHKTSRLVFGIGQNEVGQKAKENFVEVMWRPALHDLLDSNGTYGAGTQVNYLDTALRLNEKHGTTEIDHLHFVNLYSLKPRSPLFKPWSFKFKTGFDRDSIFNQGENLYFNINGGFGLTYEAFDSLHVYGLLEATAVIDNEFENKISFAAGPNLGVLWQVTANWKLWFDSSTQFYDSKNKSNTIVKHSLSQSYALSKNKVIRLSVTKQGIQGQTNQEAKLSLTGYY